MQLPELSAFTTDMQFHLLVVPAGTADVTAETMTAQSDDTISFALGNPHLTLEADHYLIDGQESVVATVKNEGAVTSQPATLVFEQSEDGEDLLRVDVPALAERRLRR